MPKVAALPSILGGRYKPLRLLGEGGMGAVYEVEHARTGERLALKMMHGEVGRATSNVERFKREARASAMIRSEHVVKVIDADVAEELPDRPPFLVMELLDGQDLGNATSVALPPRAVLCQWLTQVARGLDKAHALGLVHRDLKPENLFLTRREDGSALIKILDFGLVKGASEIDSCTLTGQVLGSPLFMAPEQARGEAVSPATDQWSLGMIAFQMLAGQPYWTANSVSHLLARLVYEKVVAPSTAGCDQGPAFDAWFLRSCHPDPASRWSTTSEQIDALCQALGVDETARAQAAHHPFGHQRAPSPVEAEDGPTLRALASDSNHRLQALGGPRGLLLAVGVLLVIGAMGAMMLRRSPTPEVAAREAPSVHAPASAPAPSLAASPALAVSSLPLAPSASASEKAPAVKPRPRSSAPGKSPLDDQY